MGVLIQPCCLFSLLSNDMFNVQGGYIHLKVGKGGGGGGGPKAVACLPYYYTGGWLISECILFK